jgi:hypothetical protein
MALLLGLLIAEALGLPLVLPLLRVLNGWLMALPAPTDSWADIIGSVVWPAVVAFLVMRYGYGMLWASVVSEKEGNQPLFCPPLKLGLTSEQTVDVVRRYVEDHPSTGSSPAGLVTLYALRDTFPCK